MNDFNDGSRHLAMDMYAYALPEELIAAFPAVVRGDSRLLVFREGLIHDTHFPAILDELPVGSALVLNNSKVVEARLQFQKQTGGVIEVFCLEPADRARLVGEELQETVQSEWNCLVGGAAKWKTGTILQKNFPSVAGSETLFASLLSKNAEGFSIRFHWTGGARFSEVLGAAGALPLPPYIKRGVDKRDSDRYQTVFSDPKGSVAAPTAALHFTTALLGSLNEKGIRPMHLTLHVGAGTFQPVKAAHISGHIMHSEPFTVSRALLLSLIEAPVIVAVGTTSLRTLESLYWIGLKLKKGSTACILDQWEAYEMADEDISYKACISAVLEYMNEGSLDELHCRTSLLIRPGYRFRSAKGLITNFHQPRSTLLLLIAAFVGPQWKHIYDHALANRYRFLSYGDSSLLWRNH